MTASHIFLDPPSPFYYGDRLFNLADEVANRDDVLLPFSRLRDQLAVRGVTVETADGLFQRPRPEGAVDYYSFGMADNYRRLLGDPNVRLKAFTILEPPVVAPHLYRMLPELTRHFERVYVHNTAGDGYSLEGVDRTRLAKGRFAQPYREVVPTAWERADRLRKLVVINANKRPTDKHRELYSKRIEAVAALAPFDAIDLFGPGWDRFWLKIGRLRRTLYWPAFKHHRVLKQVNCGPCGSKYEALSRYTFSLCFENMLMDGYVSEKLIDCLYAGTIPVYLGAPDIADHVDADCFIDFRRFASYEALWQHLQSLDDATIAAYRDAGKRFLASDRFAPFYNALTAMVEDAR